VAQQATADPPHEGAVTLHHGGEGGLVAPCRERPEQVPIGQPAVLGAEQILQVLLQANRRRPAHTPLTPGTGVLSPLSCRQGWGRVHNFLSYRPVSGQAKGTSVRPAPACRLTADASGRLTRQTVQAVW